MNDTILVALISFGATALTGIVSSFFSYRLGRRKSQVDNETQTNQAQNSLIDQLQEELTRYREGTDKRLDELETLVKGYRGFIGIQRDHMAANGVALPPWPPDLPR